MAVLSDLQAREDRQPRGGMYAAGLERTDVDEIYDMRLMHETHAARRAAALVTDNDLDHLQHLVDTMADLTRRGRHALLVEPDFALHRQIMVIANHRRLLAAWELSAEPAGALLAITTSVGHSLPRAAANHQPIVDALRIREPDQAAAAIAAHMERARTVMLAIVSGDLPFASAEPVAPSS